MVMALLPASLSAATTATPYDWSTYGFGPQRSSYDPLETTLGVDNAASLHQLWSFDLGAVTITQPVIASGVTVNGSPTDLVYAGTEHGDLVAVDAATGTEVWRRVDPGPQPLQAVRRRRRLQPG